VIKDEIYGMGDFKIIITLCKLYVCVCVYIYIHTHYTNLLEVA